MAKLVVLALCLLSLWQLSVAQAPPQCSTLNVDNPLQSPGAGEPSQSFVNSGTVLQHLGLECYVTIDNKALFIAMM